MSISNVSSQHAGVYWCGVKSNEGNYKTSLRKIQLEIKSITSFKRSPTSGQNFTYWCEYPQGAPIKKFMCKGEDPSICQPLWNTSKFSVEDDTKTRNITITVRNVTTDDAGTYWCGAENTDNKRSNPFFNRLEMTVGCEASSEVKGCEGGWVELTCKYPREDQEYQKIEVINPRGKNIQITENDVWEENGGFSLYHDTRNKNLRMAIKQLKSDDFGKYNCKFYPRPHSSPETQKLELKVVKDGCQTPFNQTAYRTAKTTITCDFPKKYSYVKFICKDNNEICEEILSTQSSVKSNGTFTLTDTNSFNMSISNVSSQHAGVYWCGVKSNEGSYRASLRKIQLQVKNITIFKRSSTIGQTFTYWCYYTQGAPIKKFICKGEDPSICQPLWSTSNKKAGKFSVEDVKKRGNVTITIRDLTINDAGTYWCGAENTDNRHSNPFFNRLEMTVGCEVSSEVKGCEGGWVELTCKYPREDQEYQKIEVINPRGKNIRTTEKDVWEEKGRFSLYHDTRNKNLRMAIKQLERDDSGKYQCKFDHFSFYGPGEQELELKVVKYGCQTPFTQTAYRTAKTTITCDFPKKYSNVKFICKDNNEICEEILSTQSSVKSNGTFTLTDTNSFNMSISNVRSQHAGVYWCGVKSKEGNYRVSLRQIQLQVRSITSFKRSPTSGQNFTYWCEYTQGAPNKKFICKGEDPSICQPLWNTSKRRMNTGKFSMEDDRARRNIIITVRNVTTDDTGTYWCGAENTDNKRSNPFFNKLEMTVGEWTCYFITMKLFNSLKILSQAQRTVNSAVQ
ncbi:polymeric immunoglobulin receptor-like isoform X1 [Thunnus thynnus]|uniref:polymeric immunoglobulin receptor-like isoform X1 n=1 Tax=Thunnus thynnus TaxID=8237 RepID=UPI003528D6C4